MSEHHARVRWQNPGGDFTYESYDRSHTWSFEGGVEVPASSAPDFLGAADRVDPEKGFTAAVSSCHMLTFLALAARKRFRVEDYSDDAVGHMEKNEDGKLAITRVVLRPRVSWGGDKQPDADAVRRLHHQAHEHCFIANSIRSEVVVEDAGD